VVNIKKTVAIIGAGPAGLIAAETLCQLENVDIHIFERKPSVARKFLLAGRGGLNLTHSDQVMDFVKKYGNDAARFEKFLERFSPEDLIAWAHSLGINTFKGSSGRIFPKGLKATPLLRAWLKLLDQDNIHFHLQHSWQQTTETGKLIFQKSNAEQIEFAADVILYAMGGGSYPHMGSNGEWVSPFENRGMEISPLEPSNCGFAVNWSDHFLSRHEGIPIKNILLSHNHRSVAGDLVVTKSGLEGGALYALSKELRKAINQEATTLLKMDMKPGTTFEKVQQQLAVSRGKMSLSNFLRKQLRLSPVQIALLYEFTAKDSMKDASSLATAIKALPIPLSGINGISRAISSAGGVKFENLDDQLMIKQSPGQFVAGEMLDWEAPTGGYLLQGCFATGMVAADGIKEYLART
jgi:uncharacterized flavoprotein (TIGR03862 family)